MRTIQDWLDEYNESHTDNLNKLAHWICVPAIVFSLLGLLWLVKIPPFLHTFLPSNLALIITLFALSYYFTLSVRLACGMIVFLGAMFALLLWMEHLALSTFTNYLIIFVVAWIGQFIGHVVEGKRPSFFKDLQFLLIGPLWLLSFVYKNVGFRY